MIQYICLDVSPFHYYCIGLMRKGFTGLKESLTILNEAYVLMIPTHPINVGEFFNIKTPFMPYRICCLQTTSSN